MSELNQIGCEEFADVAAELALGVLTGRERAEALAHLEHCDACRETVGQLTSTGEQLLGLLPAIEPPPGFETQVMARIGLTPDVPGTQPARPRRRRRLSLAGIWSTRRLLAAAAVAAAVIAGAIGGWGLRGTGTQIAQGPGSLLSSAPLVSASHQAAGKIFYYKGEPGWLYMSVDALSASGPVTCQIIDQNGHVSTVGSFKLTDGYGSWGSVAPPGAGPPAGARLVSSDGTVLATARFSLH